MTREEFGHISEAIRKDLVDLARRFLRATGGPEEAEDIVQETLVALWTLSEKEYPIRDAKALAIKITKNICISRYRKRKMEISPLKDDLIIGGPTAEERVEAADNTHVKMILYGRLSETQRKYLTMKNDEGLTLDEISEKTGKPKTSIKAAISNARKILRERMKKL